MLYRPDPPPSSQKHAASPVYVRRTGNTWIVEWCGWFWPRDNRAEALVYAGLIARAHRERVIIHKGPYKHGHTRHRAPTPEYSSWANARSRVRNPNNVSWKDYGGRGITFDDRWDSYEVFFAEMGRRRPGQSLDRVNNNNGYSFANCRWASAKMQANNRRRRIESGAVARFIDHVEGRILLWVADEISFHDAIDGLWAAAERAGLVAELGPDQVQRFLADAFARARGAP